MHPLQLAVEAVASQFVLWDEFYQEVMTPAENADDNIWPEDPLYCFR